MWTSFSVANLGFFPGLCRDVPKLILHRDKVYDYRCIALGWVMILRVMKEIFSSMATTILFHGIRGINDSKISEDGYYFP